MITLGYAYVKTIQNRDAIFADVTSKTDLIFKAFKEMLNSIEWMLPKSKEKAKEKRENLGSKKIKINYFKSQKWRRKLDGPRNSMGTLKILRIWTGSKNIMVSIKKLTKFKMLI